MKWVVFFLLVANFALLGFYQASSYMAEHQDAVVAPPPAPPYNGPIRLLSAEELAAMPKKAPESPPAAPLVNVASCYEWGSFNPTDAARALAALKKLNLQVKTRQLPKQESTRYWVYIPPQQSLEAAQAKNEEIKALGVEETFILQDAQWRNAISLGVFKDETLANKFMDKLRGLGVKGVVKTKRGQGSNETSYVIHQVLPQQAVKLTELKPHFSAGELKQIKCN